MVKSAGPFRLKSELDVFGVMQDHTGLSIRQIADETNTSSTAVQSIVKRLSARGLLFEGQAPRWDKLRDVPTAILGFTDLSEERLWKAKDHLVEREEIRQLFSSDDALLLVLVHRDKDELTALVFEIMDMVKARPSLTIISPEIGKFDPRIPKAILEDAYGGLPDRRQDGRRRNRH